MLNFILGISVERLNEKIITIHQKAFIDKIIKNYTNLNAIINTDKPIQPNHKLTTHLENENENENLRQFVDTTKYRQLIGSLIYLMTCSRPDISYSVGILLRYMHQPRELHWRYLKRLLKYIHTTKSYRLKFEKHDNKISLT